VEGACDRLCIQFSYSPKKLEDEAKAKQLLERSVQMYMEPAYRQPILEKMDRYLPLTNLVTVSVDDPVGYRGACHRHDSEQWLVLSPSAASPGLTKGPITEGWWSITLSVHSIVTGSCDYRLAVWTEPARGDDR